MSECQKGKGEGRKDNKPPEERVKVHLPFSFLQVIGKRLLMTMRRCSLPSLPRMDLRRSICFVESFLSMVAVSHKQWCVLGGN